MFLLLQRSSILVTGVALCCGFLAGCDSGAGAGKQTGNVTITVTYEGKPVADGRVDLDNVKGGSAGGGELSKEGIVKITDLPVGEYSVIVVPPLPTPQVPGEAYVKPSERLDIPEKFRASTTSPLKATIKTGSNEYKFELKE